MKQSFFARVFCIVFCLLLCLSGCQRNSVPSAKKEAVTLKILLRGSASGLNRILEKLYAQMDDTHNWRLDITLLESPDYTVELNRRLTSHEDYDLVFDAPWLGLNAMAQQGAYLDLERYFNNPRYAGLQEAFSEDYLDANRIDDRLYAIPVTNAYYDPTGIFYRKDILRACNLGFEEITTRDELLAFYDAVLQQYPNVSPISLGSRGFYLLNCLDLSFRSSQIFDVTGWSFFDYPSKIVLNADGSQVLDVVFPGDDPARFSAFPMPHNYDFLSEYLLQNAAYAKYAQPDALFALDGSDLFFSGESASFEAAMGTGGSAEKQRKLQQTIPNGEVSFWCYEPTLDADMRSYGGIVSSMQAWNFLCIPSYTNRADDAMAFLDWLYSDRTRLELFTYGVEGEDWQAIGRDEYVLLAHPSDAFSFPAYELAWSPLYQRIEKNLPQSEKELLQFSYDVNSYTKSSLAGWSIDTTHISIELAQLRALYTEYNTAFSHGSFGEDTASKIAEWHTKSEALGLETVRQSIKKQAQAYLDTHL